MAITSPSRKRESSRSAQVGHYLTQTAKIIQEWIARGEDPRCPVSQHTSTQHFRSSVSLPAFDEAGHSDDELFAAMQVILDGSVNPWTGRFVDKLYTAPEPLGVASETLLAAINANAHVMSAAPVLCLAEETCVTGLAALCGWDIDLADGMTMPGGSTSNTFAIQTALNATYPSFKTQGMLGVADEISKLVPRHKRAARPLIFTGVDGHYSLEKAAIACGMGLDSVVKVPCDADGAMKPDALDEMLWDAYQDIKGEGPMKGVPFFVNATAGSTVTGSFDALDRIADVCDRYRDKLGKVGKQLWLHVDGSWGGPVLFSARERKRMQGIERCDSLTMNPHKLLNVPHQCSFVVFRSGDALAHNALDAPYLFHSHSTEEATADATAGAKRKHASDEAAADIAKADANGRAAAVKRKLQRRESPAMMNFGCGRKGDALKFYLAWLANGSSGLGARVERGIDAAHRVVSTVQSDERLSSRLELARMSGGAQQFLQVCLRPSFEHAKSRSAELASVATKSKATQYVYTALREKRRFAVDFAPLGDRQGDFIRLVTHPSSSIEDLVELVHEIADIGDEFAAQK